jgi:hypothetical protein
VTPYRSDEAVPMIQEGKDRMTLPPILYWSAQLVAEGPDGPDSLFAGVIDASTSIYYRWHDGDWETTPLPADAVRLVVEPCDRASD